MPFRTGTYMRPALKIHNARNVIYSTSRPENVALCSKAVRFKVKNLVFLNTSRTYQHLKTIFT